MEMLDASNVVRCAICGYGCHKECAKLVVGIGGQGCLGCAALPNVDGEIYLDAKTLKVAKTNVEEFEEQNFTLVSSIEFESQIYEAYGDSQEDHDNDQQSVYQEDDDDDEQSAYGSNEAEEEDSDAELSDVELDREDRCSK